ncbi:15259_t:CDS:1, partial [Racocetra fulgida]
VFTKPEEIDEFNEIESKTFLSLFELIAPNDKKKKTKSNPPRAQNGFVLFQRDFTAYWNSCNPQENNFNIVSNLTSKLWKGEFSTFELWKDINVCEIKKLYNK